MKNLLIILLICPLFVLGQTRTKTISEKKIGNVECKNDIVISDLDTVNYVSISFKNLKYKYASDFNIIVFAKENQEELTSLVADLKTALMEMGTKSSVSWDKKDYALNLYDFNKHLYLTSKEEDGYTVLNKKNVMSLIDWLEANRL